MIISKGLRAVSTQFSSPSTKKKIKKIKYLTQLTQSTNFRCNTEVWHPIIKCFYKNHSIWRQFFFSKIEILHLHMPHMKAFSIQGSNMLFQMSSGAYLNEAYAQPWFNSSGEQASVKNVYLLPRFQHHPHHGSQRRVELHLLAYMHNL